ncbi:poly-gamma-glutamate hydrolase family protein [Staphylococcus capitis]
MKILGHTRAFSFRKVTLGAVTALIGLGTIGAMGNQAQASTHSSYSQSHRTTTNGKSTSTQSRVKTTTVKPIVTSTKVVKPVHQTSKVQTTKKVVPTKQSTKSIKPVVTKAPTKQATSSKTSVTVSKAPTTSTGKTTTTKSVTTRPKSTSAVKSTSTKPTAKTSRTSSTSKKSTTIPTKPSTSTKQPTTTPATTVPTTNQTDNNQEMIGTAPEGHIKDKYQSMTQLESETVEGVDWKKDTRDNGTKVLIVAPHGGNIEQGTTEATKALAKKGNYDYFSFEAIRPKNNTELHVTSTHYDDPTLNQMIQNRTATISIHGAAGTDQIIYLGGPPSTLRDEMETQLKSSGFTVMAPLDYIGGVKKNNFINREENNTGVQLELTTALRKAFFNNGDTSTKNRSNESNWTPLMQTFVDALYTSINNIYPNH